MVLGLLRKRCSRGKTRVEVSIPDPTSDGSAQGEQRPPQAPQPSEEASAAPSDLRTGAAGLTAAEFRRREGVVDEDVGGLGHLQVDHVGGVLQGGDGVLVTHLLQAAAVDLTERRQLQSNQEAVGGGVPGSS